MFQAITALATAVKGVSGLTKVASGEVSPEQLPQQVGATVLTAALGAAAPQIAKDYSALTFPPISKG